MSDHFKELRAMAVRLSYLTTILVVVALSSAAAQDGRSAPEADTGRYAKQAAKAKSFMVSAANPLAVEAGVHILRKGGSAIDAAIAVQLVLNLVEPQSSGIGGGAFLLHWDQTAQELKTYDGREKAPATAKPDRFMRDGQRLPFWKAVKSGLSIGVPGLVKLMEYAHQRHGKLPWTELFEPAIRLAENGFKVSPRLRNLLWLQTSRPFSKAARNYFFDMSGDADNPEPWPVGHLLKNPEFAKTLIAIRDSGAAAFYDGPIAQAVVDAAAKAPNFSGDITLDDLASYDVKERPPVCSLYRKHNVCGMGPPSSGALTVAQVLKLVERWPLGNEPRAALNPRAMHLLAEAGKLAFADRNRYMADPDFVSVPQGLLDDSYVGSRAKAINPDGAMQRRPQPGRPPGTQSAHFGRDATRESVGTSHISIIDKAGNAVSMTTTIESAFGSGVWAAGFLLNNELTDFSFRPSDRKGRPIANRVEAGKRPRSSMAPTIVFDETGEVKAVLGSPGGSRIILYVIKAVVGIVDWKLDAQAAASLRNFGSRGTGFELEFGEALTLTSPLQILRHAPSVWHGIRMRPFGHRLRPSLMTSGLHIVTREDGMLMGGADPRREGVARGD
ncbi:MAG: gamma-glutamyltransferase [Pseudomonadota bacterium]